jgi:hypothetical protein
MTRPEEKLDRLAVPVTAAAGAGFAALLWAGQVAGPTLPPRRTSQAGVPLGPGNPFQQYTAQAEAWAKSAALLSPPRSGTEVVGLDRLHDARQTLWTATRPRGSASPTAVATRGDPTAVSAPGGRSRRSSQRPAV